METQRSSVLLYGVLGILVVLALFARLKSSNDPESNWLQDVMPLDESTTSIEFKRRSDSSRQPSVVAIRNKQISDLRNQLDRKNEDLSNARKALNKKTLEFASQQTKLKETEKFVDELLGQSLNPGTTPAARVSRTLNTSGTSAGTPANPDSSQPDSIESLRTQIQTIEEQMDALQEAAESELDDAEDELQSFQSSSADVVVDIGAAAVPGLIGSLSDDKPRVRAWAAYVLGRIGEDASDAVSALTSALSDPDETVQENAREALKAIN